MKLLNQIPRILNQIRFASSLVGKEKEASFITCREFYASKCKSILYRHGSSAGIKINMRYLDTDAEGKSKSPIVLALHGTPGTYKDFSDLILRLQRKGYRVIAPNLPGMKLTDETVTFYHSTEERSELLADFMQAIDVPSVDCALVHSAGVFPMMKLWHDKTVDIKSLMLINPSGHRTIRAMKPEWLINSLLRVNLIPPGRWLYSKFGHLIAQAAKVKVDASKEASDDAVLACLTIYMAGINRMVKYYEALQQRKTPTSFFYSDRDKLIEKEIFQEKLALMGATQEHVNIAMQGEILKASEKTLDWLRVYNMKNAGHFAYKQNTNLLEEEVSRLVSRSFQSSVAADQQVNKEQKKKSDDGWSTDDDDFYGKYGNRRAYVLNMSAPTIDY